MRHEQVSAQAWRRARQRGLTLMEVLVSMLVMALGLLGIAALQTTTMKYALGTTERSNVSILLADYAERVRANLAQAPGEVAQSKYLMADAPDAKEPTFTWEKLKGTVPGVDKDCSTASCTPAELADFDMATWRAEVRRLLPGGVAVVSGSSTQGVRVTLAWRDKDMTATSQTCAAGMTGMASEACCPSSLQLKSTDTGIRCANFTVIP